MVNERNIPRHVAIIMDGNGRWAERHGVPRSEGHRAGAGAVERAVECARDLGIEYLTLYAFSTENWRRSPQEISALMALLRDFLTTKTDTLMKHNVRLLTIGRTGDLPLGVRKLLLDSVEKTKNNTGLKFNIAFNYGGRDEIVKATKKIAEKVKSGELNIDDITEETVSNNLYTKGLPDPDLLIRTSGELRTSNFLPWQITYSEFMFLDKYWPDFTTDDIDKAIEEYSKRHRRVGK